MVTNPIQDILPAACEDSSVISKQRVTDHGEVLTGTREVNAMLDLVRQETERIESRFLEPACGNGNFLAEILERKLRVVETRYGKSQLDYERNAVLAVTSIYGIDILADNVAACRVRLFGIFDRSYTAQFKAAAKEECRATVKFILERNIVHGDALSLKTVDGKAPIVFSEWSPVNGSLIKRRDFTFSGLIPGFLPSPELFPEPDLFSDLGEDVFIPKPQKDFPLVHFLKVHEHDE
jgi:SAM-dependent methyltransferase